MGVCGSSEEKTVLLCVTGCIAAYKSCEILRLLQKAGYRVKVLMTEHATQFVGPTTFRALTHEKVAIGLFDDPEDPIHHISLAQEADVVLVAPATANCIAKMAHGIADDLMSTTLLATKAPILIAPAMNSGMWSAAATQENVEVLKSRGVHFVQPDSGYLACGDIGSGRLPTPEAIADATCSLLQGSTDLVGEHVLITAGPTHEPIDPVRYIANRSSGKMGLELARAARDRGANVTLIAGPIELPIPAGIETIHVQTASQMYSAAVKAFGRSTIAILAAAVADYTPSAPSDHKLKKAVDPIDSIPLIQTQDILAELSSNKEDRIVIGFAAETNDVMDYAVAKLKRKGCDAIVANDVSRSDAGFGSSNNRAWWVTSSTVDDLGLLEKGALAEEILSRSLLFKTNLK
ncbi:bifunctional phosphopantothenoylcysteine decarboxylase/phosphopantothenate--cysteine ligase CoaBC [Collinsella bouchesdurhonensis]|uniref:bifunctional phosphopantothenoylcysteine decarboxylase/phosphopantothenate--cysteine ligase CoaBC n=1 Tax=Collinsella bouchesdurhonensis TaxID=1907654 RepID=UPI00096AB210|nr:bifunctional phosphopantothenoylcysteine decarboxylase/phosphopantothenate--cysteine ligase CoaBC [Collinsella bouchesdurhonensis]MCI5785407.1 bifunctional phosphopantothenoylcysteine decarboxylase/phosphopantothenate--cysteine ligase CoaBC [Collinsella bouchesdurhonensis]MDY3053754.1 bifunctional phosphopantothenoylcysteine decarboxylase/phosphopantothenate--cysteine ligase CoaBC [Collinsella bouchesdurhonensis]